MTKQERTALLTKRFQAIAVIKDIRRTRKILAANEFNAETFNAINGINRSIESLLDRTISFEALLDHQVEALRHDINVALDASENEAVDLLRTSTVEYFKGVAAVANATPVACTERNFNHLSIDKVAAVEAFAAAAIVEGALDIERASSAIENLLAISEELNETIPDLEVEYNEEDHDFPAELPKEEEEQDEDDFEVQLPEDDEDIDDEEDDDEDEDDDDDKDDDDDDKDDEDDDEDDDDEDEDDDEDDDDDEEDDFSIYASTKWTLSHFRYLKAMTKFMNNSATSMEALGFTSVNAVATLRKYGEVMQKYKESIQKFIDIVEPETCTVDHLLHGSAKCFRRIDKIVSLIEQFEPVRAALDKSCQCMVDASKEVYVKAYTK